MTSLYKLNSAYQQLLDKEEYTEEDELLLSQYNDDIQSKIIAYSMVIKNNEMLMGGIQREIGLMKDRYDKLMKRTEWLNTMIINSMEKNNLGNTIRATYFSVKIKLNPPKIDIFDEDKLPSDCVKIKIQEKREPDKAKIKQLLEQGINVEGAKIIQNKRVDLR